MARVQEQKYGPEHPCVSSRKGTKVPGASPGSIKSALNAQVQACVVGLFAMKNWFCNWRGALALGAVLCGISVWPTIADAARASVPAAGRLSFSEYSYGASQSGGSLQVTVYRYGGSAGAVSASYATVDGTAKAGTDYTATRGTLNWAAGDTGAKSFTVPIGNTSAQSYRIIKTFALTLSGVTGGADLGVGTAAVLIHGGTAGTVAFAATGYSTKQTGGAVTLTVKRSGGSGAATLGYTTMDGSAVGGSDYTATHGTLSWSAGDTSAKTVSVPILDTSSNPYSGSRSFTVQLYNATGGVVMGASTATVTIAGTASSSVAGTLSLAAAGYGAKQTGGTVTITVSRSGGNAATSVKYATADGTARSGTDYTATDGTLTWAAGDTASKSFTVSVANTSSSAYSGSKSFSVALSSPGGGATLGTATATVTIAGTAAAANFSFSASAYTITQAGGTVTLSVARGSGTGAVSVHYASSNGSATAGTDYTAASGTLSWAAGDTANKTFQVTVLATGTNAYSGSKSFTVSLASPSSGASLGSPATAAVSITGIASAAASSASGGQIGSAAASRLLMQGTFGATIDGIGVAAGQSYASWFAGQAAAPVSLTLPYVQKSGQAWSNQWFNNAVLGSDQLRQRMAYALSQILVVSDTSAAVQYNNVALGAYYDVLARDALGNFRTLLQDVTLSPAMGAYLNMLRSDKPDAATGVHADQNYAREVMQLFTVGLVKLNLDGSVQTDGNGNPVATYDQSVVEGMANALSGWASAPVSHTGDAAWQYDMDWVKPMVAYESHHDEDAKTILGGVVIPAGGTASSDLKKVLDTLFNHPNVGPFISKQLIQHLVTSNPSPGYVQRVAAVFNDNGSGVRGDLLAVAKAILTDPEAVNAGGSSYGKLREPLLRLTELWRAFAAQDGSGNLHESNILILSPAEFQEFPLDAPSVFNFFRPDYEYPGALTQGLVVPEFQITNEYSLVATSNELQWRAYQYIDSQGGVHAGPDYDESSQLSATSVMLHTAQWEPYAASASGLVDELNLVLMGGQMPSAMRSTLIGYAGGITGSDAASKAARVVETAELLMNSPQFAVQR
jgi:uncharacterized protein (DUF1800 family)